MESASGKDREASLVWVPAHTWRDFDIDREAAGIPKHMDGKVDFHSFRTTFCTLADETGATAKQVQTAARHATRQQTYETYVKAREAGLFELAEKVGKTVSAAQILPKRAKTGVPDSRSSIAG